MTDRHKTRKTLKIVIISFFALFIFGYSFYEIQKVVFGPKIIVLNPTSGEIVSESLIKITGQSKNIQDISLNDKKIFIDEKAVLKMRNNKSKMNLESGKNLKVNRPIKLTLNR